ncbi:YqaI family protein [Peribacillus sp. SCS-26]|uniref:YqaI family protein n=1 Tax=Paraperibacillus marinus TaxID=3115295 RepID=UPI0039064F7E
MELEHPEITQTLKTGYPQKEQPESCGTDYFGNEILVGDSIVKDPDTGEIILEDSLEDYLIEVKQFLFLKAK